VNRTTRRESLRGIATAIAAVGLAGCGGDDGGDGGDGGSGDGDRVEMTDELVFDPAEITVDVGTTVTWETVGDVGHSVTAYEDEIPDGAEYFASGGFDSEQAARDNYEAGNPDSGDVPSGETYEHTFETAGEYGYFCIPHEAQDMVGTVTVEE
jgi:plastocyanin